MRLCKYVNIMQGTDANPKEYKNIKAPERGLKIRERVIIVNDDK